MKKQRLILLAAFVLMVSNKVWTQTETVDVIKVGELTGGVVQMTIDQQVLIEAFELAIDNGTVFNNFELEYRHDTTISLIGYGMLNDSTVVFAIETWTTDLGDGYNTYLVRQFQPLKVTCSALNCETTGCTMLFYQCGELKGAPYDCSECIQEGSECRKVIEYKGGFWQRLLDGIGALATTLTISISAGAGYRR